MLRQILFYFVVNPLWDNLQPSRFAFWLLFYGFPFVAIGVMWIWRPLQAWLRKRGLVRAARLGALLGGFLALPAAIYRGLLGGMAAGFGTYGWFGPVWGAVVGFAYFLGVGTGLGVSVASLSSLLRHR